MVWFRANWLRLGLVASVVGVTMMGRLAPTARAERPLAPALLPEKTLAILHIPNAQDLVTKFKEGAMGRILSDEQIKPLARHLYGSVADAFGQVQDQVGLPLEKILAIPQGELCIALVQPAEGQPALVALLDAGDEILSAQKLIERAAEQVERQGATKTTESFGDVLLTNWSIPGDRPRRLTYAVKDNVVLVSTNLDVAKQMLEQWNGSAGKDESTLSKNHKFTAVMNRCLGSRDERPQIAFYADPIELVRTGARGNFAAQTGLALLPTLGLDGLQALGGSLIMGTDEFDAIQHFHVLLESPRSGVLKAIALEGGEATPEPWVPGDLASYMTLHWNADTTYREVSRLIDSFQGEGSTDSLLKQRFSDRVGMDVRGELIEALDGRITYLTWFEPPARINSQMQLLALKLKDANAFRGSLDKVLTKFSEQFERQSFGGVVYHRLKVPEGGQRRQRNPDNSDRPRVSLEIRVPQPCLAILGDYLVVTDGPGMIEHCIVTQSDATKSLANELDFKLITGKIARQVGGNTPAMIVFNRPEEGMRMLYDLAQAENTRSNLTNAAQNNPVFRALNEALEKNPLPPFSVLAQYLAPGGGMVTSDETGFHYTAFALKRK